MIIKPVLILVGEKTSLWQTKWPRNSDTFKNGIIKNHWKLSTFKDPYNLECYKSVQISGERIGSIRKN